MDYEVRLAAFDAPSIAISTGWFLLVALDPTRTTAEADRAISKYIRFNGATLPTTLHPSFSKCSLIDGQDRSRR